MSKEINLTVLTSLFFHATLPNQSQKYTLIIIDKIIMELERAKSIDDKD